MVTIISIGSIPDNKQQKGSSFFAIQEGFSLFQIFYHNKLADLSLDCKVSIHMGVFGVSWANESLALVYVKLLIYYTLL